MARLVCSGYPVPEVFLMSTHNIFFFFIFMERKKAFNWILILPRAVVVLIIKNTVDSRNLDFANLE